MTLSAVKKRKDVEYSKSIWNTNAAQRDAREELIKSQYGVFTVQPGEGKSGAGGDKHLQLLELCFASFYCLSVRKRHIM